MYMLINVETETFGAHMEIILLCTELMPGENNVKMKTLQ